MRPKKTRPSTRRDLERLTFYDGASPCTNGALTQIFPNLLLTSGNQYVSFTEDWLAYVDQNGWGVGLYKRGEHDATAYRYLSIGQTSATSYFAFLDTTALIPGYVNDYTLYAKVGNISQLRDAFGALHQAGR